MEKENKTNFREEYAETMMNKHCSIHKMNSPNHIIKDAFRKGFDNGVSYGKKEIIEKASKWLSEEFINMKSYYNKYNKTDIYSVTFSTVEELISNFITKMESE